MKTTFIVSLLLMLFGCVWNGSVRDAQEKHSATSVKSQIDAYRAGEIDCASQDIMSKDDCLLGVYTKAYPSENELELLKSNEIKTPADYRAVVKAANSYREYSTDGLSGRQLLMVIFDYLQARKTAESVHLSMDNWIKKKRDSDRKEKIARDREFPFYAELSCSINGGLVNVHACFYPSGAYDGGTLLEVRNGDEYHAYQPMQIFRAGVLRGSTLVVSLKNHFELSVQNNSVNFLLNLTVRSSKTNAIVFEKSVGQFGVINLKN